MYRYVDVSKCTGTCTSVNIRYVYVSKCTGTCTSVNVQVCVHQYMYRYMYNMSKISAIGLETFFYKFATNKIAMR